jgi:hypothetical protein
MHANTSKNFPSCGVGVVKKYCAVPLNANFGGSTKMTTLDRGTLQALAQEVAKLIRKEKGRLVPKSASDLIHEVLMSYNLNTSGDTISEVASCLSKRRIPGKKRTSKKGTSIIKKIYADDLLEDARAAEYHHRQILGNDY